jgi:lipopolysaccharide export system permease protein
MMFIARDWLAAGKIPAWIGMWWPHVLVIILGLFLLYRNQKKPA